MKHKLQTLLKHKLQWLLLLAALLGVSQGVWATYTINANTTFYIDATNFKGNYSNGVYIAIVTNSTNGGKIGNIRYGDTGGVSGYVPKNDKWDYKSYTSKSGNIYTFKVTSQITGVYGILVSSKDLSSYNDLWEVNVSGTTESSISGKIYTLSSDYTTLDSRRTSCSSGTWSDYCTTVGGTAKVNGSTTTNISRGESVTLSLTGQTSGSTIVWQKSTDGGSSWSAVGSTSDTPTQNTQYRAKVTKGCDAYSSVATVKLPTTIYVDVKSAASWTAAYLYYWGGADDNGWPGTAMTAVPGNDGWYSGEIPADRTNYIINQNKDGDVNQTNDLTTDGKQKCIKVKSSTGKHDVEETTCPTTCTAPTVVTNNTASGIGLATATVKGTITNGTCTVTASGIAYGTSANPTTGKSVSYTSGKEFSASLTGLTPGTKYYYRTYATTASGTEYGSEYSFTTTACTAPSSVTSTQMAAANYCKGVTATALKVTGSGGVTPYTYQWYSNTTASATGGTSIDGATSQTYTPPTSTAGDKYYYCVVKSASPCASSTKTSSVSGKIHVDATSVAGNITADASSVCNGNGTTLTLGGKTGNVTKWQKSTTSSSTGFSDIANTTTSLSTGSLTQNTWYRAVVTNGVCLAATSTAVGVTVVDRPSITTQPASTVVACSGAVPTPNSISVVASGTDLSYQWQLSSTSDEGPWNDLSGRKTDTFTFGYAPTGGGTYRCKITSATCSDDPIYTTVSTLTVVPNPTAGTISGSAEACSGVSGGVSLTLSGHTSSGTGIQWQKSTNSGSTWSNISGATSATLSTSQTVATQYRAVVTTTLGSCSRNTSAYPVAMKAPMALTSITLTPSTICTGGESTVTANGLVLGGGSVAYTSSATSKATVAKVSDSEATVSGVAVGNATITATLSGGCGSTITKTANISVSEGPAKFTLTAAGGTTICSAGGKLRLSGSESGFSYQLYKNGSAYGSPVEGTGSALEFDVFESGDYVCRAYLTSSPSCYTVMTGEVTLHISLTPTLIPATPTVTSYTPVTITSINTDILTWEISGEGNTAYLYDKTSNTVKVKASAAGSPYTITATTSGGCSQTATLTVNADVEKCN